MRPSNPADLVRDHLSWPADVILHPDHSMLEALERLRDKHRTFAPVVDGDAIVGVLSLRNLGGRAGDQPDIVMDGMVSTVPFLYDDDPVVLGASIAAHTEIQHFCVVDRDHLLVGIMAYTDPQMADLPLPTAIPAIEPAVARRRLAVTPGRAATDGFGELGSYAEGPTLYVDGRSVGEPEDRPTPGSRRRRETAMRSQI